MSDLDDEELIATRKLNGLDDGLYKIYNLKEISERFNNGTETLEDIMYYCPNYKLTIGNNIEMQVVEKRYFDKLVDRIKELEENSIPKQKVIDKININSNIMLETKNKYPSTYTALDEWRNAKAQNEVLEKILEDK